MFMRGISSLNINFTPSGAENQRGEEDEYHHGTPEGDGRQLGHDADAGFQLQASIEREFEEREKNDHGSLGG